MDTLFINVHEIILLDTLDLKRYSLRKPVVNFLNAHVLIELFHEPKPCYLSGTGGSGDENDNDTTVWLAYLAVCNAVFVRVRSW